MNRRASLLKIKIRAGKVQFTMPILYQLLVYFVSMLHQLKPFAFGHKEWKFYQVAEGAGEVKLLLNQLAECAPLDLVDVEAEDPKEGKVVVKVSLW